MPKIEPLQFGKLGEAAHGVVVGLSFAQVQFFKPLGVFDVLESRAGDRRVADGKPPQPLQPLHGLEGVVGDVVAAEDDEVLDFVELLQYFQPLVGDLCVFDGEGFQLRHARQMRQARVGHGGVAELQAAEVRQAFDLLQSGVGDLYATAQVQQAEFFEALQFGQSVVGDVVVEEREIFEVGQFFDVRQSGVGHVGASAEVERPQLRHLSEDFQARVGDFRVFQDQVGELGEGRESFNAFVVYLRAPEH